MKSLVTKTAKPSLETNLDFNAASLLAPQAAALKSPIATLFHMLPQDVIINHIAPYTYLPKPDNLMVDIRTFINDYQLIEDYYLTMLNGRILLHDLLLYYKNRFDVNRIRTIYKQNFRRSTDVDTKNRILLAKMTPLDRCLFINDYILIDEES